MPALYENAGRAVAIRATMEPMLSGLPIRYTLCFLTRGESVLMLHRSKPPNLGLWNGVGGRIEPGEGLLECALREVREETGYRLAEARPGGLLTWEGFETPPGGLAIFWADAPAGEPAFCSEGELAWKPRAWVYESAEVVSNIHVFAPAMLELGLARHYHFVYRSGDFISYTISPLKPDWLVA